MRQDDPHWVVAILDGRGTMLLARLALASAYIVGGLTKLLDFSRAVAEQEHFGLYPGWIWAGLTIVVELIGSFLVVSGRFVWLGAGALGVLTFVAMIVANDFWDMKGAAQFQATNAFFEHLGLIGGFVLVAHLSAHTSRQTSSV